MGIKKTASDLKPVISVFIIITTLMTLVILQMEERRLGYYLLKLTRDQKKMVESRRLATIRYTELTRPQLVESVASSQFTLKKLSSHQMIQMANTSQNQEVSK